MKKIIVLFCLILSGCLLPKPEGYDQLYYQKSNQEKALFHLEIALNSYGQSRYYDAEKNLRLANYYLPKSRKIKLNLAMAILNLEQYIEAEQIINELLVDEPYNTTYILTLANSYFLQKKYDKSLNAYKDALSLTSEKEKALQEKIYRNISEIYFIQGYEIDALCNSSLSFYSTENGDPTTHLAVLNALNMSPSILSKELILEEARQRRDEGVIFWFAMAYYDLGEFKEAYFLAKIVEAELISEGNIIGFSDFYNLIDKKVNYRTISEDDSKREFIPNKLQRNYWAMSVLKELVL